MKKYFTLILFSFLYAISKDKNFTKIECKLIPVPRLSSLISSNEKSDLFSSLHRGFTFGTSTNWSGYASLTNLNNPTSNSVSKTHGSWIVPQLSPTSNNTYCAIWIGIDGYRSSTVEQIGTEHNWINGHQVNYAWFEMYPRNSFVISGFPVRIGDIISANVAYKGNNIFRLSINNRTRKISTVIPINFTTVSGAQRNSAEWIIEAPFLNSTLPLADFNTAHFRKCWCVINGSKGAINDNKWKNDKIRMVTNNGITKAVPTNLINKDNMNNFNVVWKHQ